MTVSLHNLTCVFGQTRALDGVTAKVDAPALIGLTGPNGAGKSTLLHVLAARQLPASGHATVCEVDTRDPRARALVGFVPETPALPPEMDAASYLGWVAEARGCEVPKAWLSRTGLEALGPRRLGDLSTGQRRRVALAATLLFAPPVLLLDEPFSGLDAQERDLWCDLLEAHAEDNVVLLSSHETAMLDRLGTRRWALEAGRLTEVP